MDDLQSIITDNIKSFGNRRVLLIQGIIITVLIIIIIILAAFLGGRYSMLSWGHAGGDATCTTADCLHLAGFLVDNMDTTVDPCSDFHRFSCGGYASRHSIAPDEKEVTMIQMMEDELDELLREMIENPTVKPSATSAEAKLRDFFLSCVHDYGRMKEGGRLLVNLILTKLNGWYVLDPENWRQAWNFQDALAKVQADLLVSAIFEGYYTRDPNTKRNVIALYFYGTGMSYQYYSEDKLGIQDSYKDYMRETAVLLIRDANLTLTATEVNDRVEQFVADAFDMEYKIASTLQILRQQGRLYERITTTLGEIHRNYTQLDWLNVIQRMLEEAPITEDTPIQLVAPSYFAMIDNLLRNETEAHIRDRVMNNYFVWRIAFKYASHLSWEYRAAGFRFQETLYGQKEWEPTWKTCLATVQDRLGTLLATEFIRTHIAPETKQQVSEMFNNIRMTIGQRISELPWMDVTTRQRAIEKINSTKAIIGFTEMYYNNSLMDELHSMLEIDRSVPYFINLLKLNKFQRRIRIRVFLDKDATTLEHMPILGGTLHYWVQPFFIQYYNTLLIPAGVLSRFMYNVKRQQVFNYGFLGSIIAAETLESIGESGRYIWTNNSYVNWWTIPTRQEYTKTSECFIRYFDGLTAGPFEFDGQNVTVSVSGRYQAWKLMDDLGGIRAAFRTYRQLAEKNEKEILPAGLSSGLTHDQLFFVSTAQTKCYLRTDQFAYETALRGQLPEDLELNSLLSHLPEFTTTFKCPIGSPMRTSYQCETY